MQKVDMTYSSFVILGIVFFILGGLVGVITYAIYDETRLNNLFYPMNTSRLDTTKADTIYVVEAKDVSGFIGVRINEFNEEYLGSARLSDLNARSDSPFKNKQMLFFKRNDTLPPLEKKFNGR